MSPYNMAVQTCQSGAEALNLVKQSNYDIIFMDHMMPVMDGIEAAERIRAMENGDGYFRNLPVIALTANAMAGQKEIFLQHGINDFIAKPIDVRRLDEILERWLPEEKRIPQPKDNGS
jgi:CheY-like chemotaxis protein